MTYEELVAAVKTAASKMDAKKVSDHLAIQVNIEGEAEGAFYIELNEGEVAVEPYDYVDRHVLLTCQASQILDVVNGKLDLMQALNDGQIRGEGDLDRLTVLVEIIKKVPVKRAAAKTAEKKTETKPAAKKAAAKTEVKAEEKKTAAKAEEKKAEAKAEEKKAEAKAEEKKAEAKAEEKKVAAKAPAKKAPAKKAVRKA